MVDSARKLRDNHKQGSEARMRERMAHRMNERDIIELERGQGAL